MFGILKVIFEVIWAVARIPVFVICAVFGLYVVLICINLFIGYLNGLRLQKRTSKVVKKRSALLRLLVDFPHRYVLDMFEHNPNDFPYKGCVIFCGRQGCGKTISMIEYAMRMQEEYPDCKCLTNCAYLFEDDELSHWKKLVNYKNGAAGVIACLDETQNWFSSNQSRNFPPEMLQVITQNRKNRRIILGTSQNFYLLSKAIRSQATEVRDCCTFFGCLTVVSRKEPILDCDGSVVEWKKLGRYFFVHSEKLRNAYDTYKVIESLSDSGFKDNFDLTRE